MDTPKHVLLVTNSANDTEIDLIKEAFTQGKAHGLQIRLSLVHIIPNLPTCYFNIPSMVMLAERYYDEAKKNLNKIGQQLEVSQNDQWLVTGRIRTEVLRLANKLGIQFILASSSNIQDLHKSVIFKKEKDPVIRSINNFGSLKPYYKY